MTRTAHHLTTMALLVALSASFGQSAAQTAPKVIKKVPMDFPERAVKLGIDKGVVKTRITIDAFGGVTTVDIVETSPPKAKVLNDTVTETLREWKFEGNGKPHSFEYQVVLTSG